MADSRLDYSPDNLDNEVAQLLGTGAGDPLEDPATLRALAKLRLELGQDVIFVSRFKDDTRVLELVESEPATVSFLLGAVDPLQQSWCYSVVSGRLPELVLDARTWIEAGAVPRPGIPIGTHISTPIRLEDGTVYGTLCAFSSDVVADSTVNDLARLRLAAEVLGKRLARLAREKARQ
ncbi:MAG TPA: histidine kinase [Ramlibacter sp.]|nr:histidine kinase [Ramlibacter sp.]